MPGRPGSNRKCNFIAWHGQRRHFTLANWSPWCRKDYHHKVLFDLSFSSWHFWLITKVYQISTFIFCCCREIARILADDYKKRVMIVDTSNEIGGDGDIPHPGIGGARRLQVPNSDMQHKACPLFSFPLFFFCNFCQFSCKFL